MDTKQDDKETGRIEAFSDGVFAVAITLLILNIQRDNRGDIWQFIVSIVYS